MTAPRRRHPHPHLDRLGTAVFRLLLTLYPPEFRRRFGVSAIAAAQRRARDVGRLRGALGTLRYWIRQAIDLIGGAGAEWRDRSRRNLFRTRPLEIAPMETLRGDVRYALRIFRKRPAFALVIVATLALGIGASTSIFSIINAVVLRPLPYERPDELVMILDDMRAFNLSRAPLAEYELRAVREQATRFDAVEAFTPAFPGPFSSEDGDPEQVLSINHTAGLFDMLGITPALGRLTAPEDTRPLPAGVFADASVEVPRGVVMLGHAFWQRRFGGDPEVLGEIINVDSREFEIIGVLPPHFRLYLPDDMGGQGLTRPVDLFRPLQIDFASPVEGAGYLQVVARMSPGVTLEQANADVAAVAERVRANSPRSGRGEIHMSAHPWGAQISRHLRPALLTLLGAVAFVLLIACANVANLLLANAAGRRHEIAVRAALGAPRGRVVRQAFTESLLLGVLAGGAGLVAAQWGTRALLLLQPAAMPRSEFVGVSPTVAAFTLGATLLAVLLFGTAPALALSSTRGAAALSDRGSAGGSQARSRLRDALVVVEVALSLVLLVGAGLTLRSFSHLRQIDPGFTAERVTSFGVILPFFEYRDAGAQEAFMNAFHGRLGEISGVESAGVATSLPLSGDLFAGIFHTLDEMAEDDPGVAANYRGVGPGYFETMGTPLLDGRTLERDEAAEVIVVDRQLAEGIFPGERAVGRQLRLRLPGLGSGPTQIVVAEIVGVVGDVRLDDLEGAQRATVYFPYARIGFGRMSFVLRSDLAASDLLPGIRRELAAINADLPVHDLRPLTAYLDDAVAPVRFSLLLIALFGGCAMSLAAIGLYGVIAHGVREQTRDFGVRLAFGATAGRIVRAVVARGAMLASLGVVLGLGVALPLTRALQSLFVGVSPADPPTFAAIAILLLVVALLACFIPARRAARLDPATSLRAE